MLPNLQMKPLDIFGLELHAFGFLVGLAIIVGTILAGRRAKQIGLSERVVADVAIWAVVFGFIGAHLYSAIFYFPERIVEDPLYLLKVWDGISSFGGFIGGALGVGVYFWRKKELPFLPYADAIVYGFAFAWIFGRLGCTIAYDHPGLTTDFFLGMEYTSGKLAPGVRHNLGMYEFFWAIIISAVFYANRNKTHFKGWFLATFVLAYTPLRFFWDFLREKQDIRHFGLTGGQYAAIALTGLAIWLVIRAMKNKDMLVPDGTPKFWPTNEAKALERSKPAGGGGGSRGKKKGNKARAGR